MTMPFASVSTTIGGTIHPGERESETRGAESGGEQEMEPSDD